MEINLPQWKKQALVRDKVVGKLPTTGCPISNPVDYEHHRINSDDPHGYSQEIMRSCQLKSVISTPSRIIEPYINFHIKEHLTNLTRFSKKSAYGDIFIADFAGGKVIVKTSKKQEYIDTQVEHNELVVGITAINKLRKYTPNYVFTYGGFICGKPRISDSGSLLSWCNEHDVQQMYTVIELVPDSVALADYCIGCSHSELTNVICQLIYSITTAHMHIRMVHADMHTDNVLIQDMGEKADLLYRFGKSKDTFVISSRHVVRIIDYGLSRAYDTTTGEMIGLTYRNDNNSAFNDFIRILASCRQLIRKSTSPVKEFNSKMDFIELCLKLVEKRYAKGVSGNSLYGLSSDISKLCDPSFFMYGDGKHLVLHPPTESIAKVKNDMLATPFVDDLYLTDYLLKSKRGALNTGDVVAIVEYLDRMLISYESLLDLTMRGKLVKSQNETKGIYNNLLGRLRELDIVRFTGESSRNIAVIKELYAVVDNSQLIIIKILSQLGRN